MQPDDVRLPVDDLPLSPDADSVWSYRGYHLKHNDFTTAIVHLYRGELTRANAWRSRLDVTTNWALLSTGAAITFAFGDEVAHHSVILLNILLVTLFLFVEARRYRTFEVWSYRIRLIETNFYAPMMTAPFKPSSDWADKLAQNLMHPRFPISIWEALGRRLRRNYAWIYLVLELAWLAKLLLTPAGQLTAAAFVRRAGMGVIPGGVVLGTVVAFNLLMIAFSILTLRYHAATGEVLDDQEQAQAGRSDGVQA